MSLKHMIIAENSDQQVDEAGKRKGLVLLNCVRQSLVFTLVYHRY
jgi:hypothetical protein